ncbi:MAG: DUF429 domain-containing protein [Haloferacaceae archaeon]
MYVGVDGCPDGWIAVSYDEQGYHESGSYAHFEDLYRDYEDAAMILVDIPIGLREDSGVKRPCDAAARQVLAPRRHASVFAPPIRPAVHANSYEEAKSIQEERTEGSLGVQSWAIAGGIAQLDTFLRETEPGATDTVREAHPEVAFWALGGGTPTAYSKTGRPAAAFFERVDVLEGVDPDVLARLREAGTDLAAEVGLDDLVDAFALALTASPLTGELRILPREQPDDDPGDPEELPMEMVYALPRDGRR